VQPWKTLQRRVVLQPNGGRFLTVEQHQVQLPDGRVIEEWPWLITPSFVNVAVVTESGHFVCFRQPKYAVEGLTLAVVGGYLELGEEPLVAAQREVLEETGYTAPSWQALGRYAVDGNRGCGVAHLFLARQARWSRPIHADDLEEQELLLLTRAEVAHALRAGEFKIVSWAAVMALALLEVIE
jgi:ADP-ribose pyrophosphatase